MVHFKKIMVCIDLSDLDDVLIQYAHTYMKSLQADSLVFLHVYQKHQSNILFGKAKQNPDLKTADALKIDIQQKLDTILIGAEYQWSLEIIEGEINDMMLETVKRFDIDLLVMGRKQELKDSEGLPKKTVKKAQCSILLIPEIPFKEFKKVLVPTDFSEYSALAVKASLDMLGPTGHVFCQHVYEVPSGYHKTGKDYYEFAKVMEGHAKNDSNDFIKKYHLPEDRLSFIYVLDENGRPAKEIMKCAKKTDTTMISMGSKGRTGAASILLGSVAEDIVGLNDHFPLLVIKKKKENLGFFDAIGKM